MTTTALLGEYETRRISAPAPTPADVLLADQLAGDHEGTEARLTVRWLASGQVEVAASSWVGVARFSELEIHVVPKFVGGSLRVLRMLEYASGISLLRRLPTDRPLPANGDDLFDLICLLLVEETTVLLRDGLLRDYRPVDDSLNALRGRLRYREQYLRRFGQLDQLECSFDEYDGNTAENQLLAAALEIARRRAREPEIRFSALRLVGVLTEVCEPPTSRADWYERTITYNRRNSRYRPAHELAKLVLRGVALDDLFDTMGNGRITAFMLNMNTIFERFVTRLVTDALSGSGLSVSPQARVRAAIRNDATGRSYSTIQPDLVIDEPVSGRSVPIDVKYKLYGGRKISTGDIYQAFMYAFALGTEPTDRRGGLLYPTTADDPGGTRLSVRSIEGPIAARIIGAGIDVPSVLDALASDEREAMLRRLQQTVEQVTGFQASSAIAAV